MKSISIAIACAFLAGCGTTYASMDKLPAQHLEIMKRAEAYYLQKAVEDAAFRFGCEKDRAVATVVATTKGHVCIDSWWPHWYDGERPATIGVDACGQRTTYKIVCGYGEGYSEAATEGTDHLCSGAPCQVVLEGTPAQSAMNRAGEESTAAALRAQEMQQQSSN